ncbi:MAG: hypothetical protein IT372_02505 [Polyangiaceae bacterium]|nr:hypothetical protein [Polyangiaceae bacterium]
MTHYRDDLDAARARIETLEAKVKERDASIDARDAEIAEMRAEIARIRRGEGPSPSPSRSPDAIAAGQRALLVALAASGLAMATGYALMRPATCHIPAVTELRTPHPLPIDLPAGISQLGPDGIALDADTGDLDRAAAAGALAHAAELAKSCRRDDARARSYRVRVVLQPGGSVRTATVLGEPLGPTATGECIAETFRSAVRVPAFDGAPVTLVKTVKVD